MTTTSSYPKPNPSISTPNPIPITVNHDDTEIYNSRPRRHTITRPDSAMALLSDLEDDEDAQQETFDRISGILSSLIQEANNAVRNNISAEDPDQQQCVNRRSRLFTSSTIISNQKSDSSRIPRLRKKSRASITPTSSKSIGTTKPSIITNNNLRNGSITISSSATTTTTSILGGGLAFSPTSSTSTSSSNSILRSPSPTTPKKFLFKHHHTVPIRPRSGALANSARRSMTPRISHTNRILTRQQHQQYNPITESFKRLDTSMALVDSLSRDLATSRTDNHDNTKKSVIDSKLTLLLLVPLLHIPHSLITMFFDFCTSGGSNNSTENILLKSSTSNTASGGFSSMIFWACVFAVTNLMVDQVAAISPFRENNSNRTRRLSLPGAYKAIAKSSNSIISTIVPGKKSWISATTKTVERKQDKFDLLADPHNVNKLKQATLLKRRNSI